MPYLVDHSYHVLKEEGGGRSTLPRSPASTSGAILTTPPAFSCVADARSLSIGALVLLDTGRYAKANINESWRGSPIPSETIVPLLKSAESIDKPTATRCMAGKADLSIYTTCASTAARIIPPPRRSTSTNEDVL
jgi:hypothetical protein